MTAASEIGRRIRALSPRERLLLLVCAAAIGLILLVRLAVVPALAEYRKAMAGIPVRRATLARYEAVRIGQDNVAARLADAAGRLREREEGLLPGDDPSASGAYEQGILKPRVARNDMRLTSIRTLGPVAKGDYHEVAVQMDFQTSTEGLAVLLAEIAREPKILRVKKLTVNSGIHSMALAGRPDSLNVSIVVAGMAGSRGEAKPAAGGGE